MDYHLQEVAMLWLKQFGEDERESKDLYTPKHKALYTYLGKILLPVFDHRLFAFDL